MLDPKSKSGKTGAQGRVVYRRSGEAADVVQAQGRVRASPALTPLLIGFALLLVVIVLLGALSVRRLNSVNENVADAEVRHAQQLQLLLSLRGALTQVDNETRARMRTEARGLAPPLKVPLNRARDDVRKFLPQFETISLWNTEKWRTFQHDIDNYLSIIDDPTQYNLDGYEKFHALDNQLNGFFQDTQREHARIEHQNEETRAKAAKDIETLTWLALVTGVLVAVGTILEAQRRFRQLQRTLEVVRRERQFSAQILEGMVSAVAALDADKKLRSANDAFFALFPTTEIGKVLIDETAINDQTGAETSIDNRSPDEKNQLAPEAARLLQTVTVKPIMRATYHGRWKLRIASDEKTNATNRSLASQIGVMHDGKDGRDGTGQHTLSAWSANESHTFEVYSSPLEIDGMAGQILTLVDVTEAAQAEVELRQQASLAAMGQATAQVAHEIKNPLGSIRLGVEMLRDMTHDREAITTIDLVERGIEHLNKLTIDVTRFSRRVQLDLVPHDVHEILDSSLNLVSDMLRDKTVEVKKNYHSASLITDCDEDQLRQVFVNLFANAIDASAKNSPLEISTEIVAARVERRASGNNRPGKTVARISVEDHGAGMDETTQRSIFEPFFTTKKRGTGLGLAIVKKIVEAHGGEITVESEPGKGTKFVVDLPLQQETFKADVN
ncbi:MAG: hypothetical protein NVSMB56_15150 [Pyrinomonadaceae bacterium]